MLGPPAGVVSAWEAFGAPAPSADFANQRRVEIDVLSDAHGAPLSNYISWRDQRTTQALPDGRTYVEAVRSRWTDDEFAQLGRELQPGSVTSLLFCLAECGELPRGARVSTIGDFVIGRLCEAAPRMHRSHGIGLLDLRTHRVPLEKAPEAYRTFQRKEDGCIKVVLDPWADSAA